MMGPGEQSCPSHAVDTCTGPSQVKPQAAHRVVRGDRVLDEGEVTGTLSQAAVGTNCAPSNSEQTVKAFTATQARMPRSLCLRTPIVSKGQLSLDGGNTNLT